MAGGMRRRLGVELNLGQRAALSRADRGQGDERLRRRHCWVVGPHDNPGPWPGLVIEWSQTYDRQWQARVVYVISDPQNGTSVECWMPAALLRPAQPEPDVPTH